MQNSMAMFTFSVFDQEYVFWANLVQKIKIVSSRWNLILSLIQIFRIKWCCSLFCFRPNITCLGQFCLKYQNCQLAVKLDTWTNSNMLNSMMLFTFFVFDRKHPSWTNLVQIFNIFSLRWNLIPRLIWLRWIQWQCSLFFFNQKHSFWANLVQNVDIVSLRLNLVASIGILKSHPH